ncbi:MAG TPA: hypothetical protein VGB41_05450 [Acidimicrobiia bacterium]
MSSQRSPVRVLALAALMAVVVIACGDDTTSTDSGQQVIFGEGEIPSTVPADFPIPQNGVIGSTLIDRINHKTEFSVQLGVDLTTAVQFFDVELVNRGYVVTSSAALSDQLWRIEFNQGELIGQVTVNSLGGQISQAVITLNVA